jgi:hypothetical protein
VVDDINDVEGDGGVVRVVGVALMVMARVLVRVVLGTQRVGQEGKENMERRKGGMTEVIEIQMMRGVLENQPIIGFLNALEEVLLPLLLGLPLALLMMSSSFPFLELGLSPIL